MEEEAAATSARHMMVTMPEMNIKLPKRIIISTFYQGDTQTSHEQNMPHSLVLVFQYIHPL